MTERPRRFGPWRVELRAFLGLFALAGLAVAQPTFDLLDKNPIVLVTRRTTRLELVGLALVLVVAPPLALWLVEVAAGIAWPRGRRLVHAALLALVAAVLAVEVLKHQTALGSTALVALGVTAGASFGVLVARLDALRLWLRFLAIAPVVFAMLFLFFSTATTVVFAGDRGAARVTVGRPARVVMVVLDEFPLESLLDGNGKIDAALFPNFARLAAGSTWYRNSSTVAPYTDVAVPALLTGSYPRDPNAPAVTAEYPHNLFTALGATYAMNVHQSLTQLCPLTLCTPPAGASASMPRRTKRLLVDTFHLWRDFASPKRVVDLTDLAGVFALDPNPLGTAARFVATLRPSKVPRLDFLHVFLPHQPWRYFGTGQDTGATGIAPGDANNAWGSKWAALAGKQRHLLQLQATDALLGQIVARLVAVGAYDDSMVVITADHGAAFTAVEPIRGISRKNAPEIVWTPLFVKQPHQGVGVVDDRPARSIDVLPTIADVLHLHLPWKVDGHSLLGPRAPEGARRVTAWKLDTLEPAPGKDYVTVDGATGFAAAIKGRASPFGGDPRLRLYRVGPYGDLLGRAAAPLVTSSERGPSGQLADPARFTAVRPAAPLVPWTDVRGTVSTAEPDLPLAVAVNGVVAGFAGTYVANRGQGPAAWWAIVPPTAFRPGPNQITLYVVRGDPSAPRLVSVRLGAA